MIAPTRISIDAVHAPVYYVESVTSTLNLAASLLADTDDDHRGSSKRRTRPSRPLLDHPTRPGPPRLDHHLSARFPAR